jgi:hypothetical protein
MVRTYKKKREKFYSKERLNEALKSIHMGTSIRQASTTFNMPFSTLQRFCKIDYKPASGGRHQPVFNVQLEELFEKYILDMSSRFLGFSTVAFRRFGYDLAVANHLNFPESWHRDKCCGKDWMSNFMRRHPSLSLRKPEATSLARASGFNKTVVEKFYNLLREVMRVHNFRADRIYNVDETGMSTTQVPAKIIARKGLKQVGKIVSQERGKNITVTCCVNACGHYVPPMFIFPRVRAKPELIDEAPSGSLAQYQSNGWMSHELFLVWIKHFCNHVKPTAEDPVLLLLDNHCSHISFDVVEYARSHHIEMLSFPPHCSHKLQPLDRCIFGPLKSSYSKACDDWMATNPGRPLTEYQVAGRFSIAYMNAATIKNAVSSFECTGIFPLNSQLFGEADFAPAETTNCEQPMDDLPLNTINVVDIDISPVANATTQATLVPLVAQPSGSGSSVSQISSVVTPTMLRAPPKGCRSITMRKRKNPITTSWLTNTMPTPPKKIVEKKCNSLMSAKPSSSRQRALSSSLSSDEETPTLPPPFTVLVQSALTAKTMSTELSQREKKVPLRLRDYQLEH